MLLHGRSVSVPIGALPLTRECILGIHPAIGVSTAGGGRALRVTGELAIAGIAPHATLQAVAVRLASVGRSRHRSNLTITPTASWRRRLCTRIKWVGIALRGTAGSRRSALAHRLVAAILIGAAAPGDDVHANGKSRVVGLGLGLFSCQSYSHHHNRESESAHGCVLEIQYKLFVANWHHLYK